MLPLFCIQNIQKLTKKAFCLFLLSKLESYVCSSVSKNKKTVLFTCRWNICIAVRTYFYYNIKILYKKVGVTYEAY